MRDVGILDVYRHKEGAALRGAKPVIVQFKARREKEQIMWRAKEKLRDTDIVVTEDSQQRLLELMKAEAERIKKYGVPGSKPPSSPTKKPSVSSSSPTKAPGSPTKAPSSPLKAPSSPTKVPSSPLKKSSSSNLNFSYSSQKPAHLGSLGSTSKSKKSLMLSKNKKKEAFNLNSVASFLPSDEDDELEDDEIDEDMDNYEEAIDR